MPIEVTREYKNGNDPNLSSLEKYSELTAEYGLIERPVKVDEEDDEVKVTIRLTYGARKYEFPSISKAVKFLVLLYHTAQKGAEEAGAETVQSA